MAVTSKKGRARPKQRTGRKMKAKKTYSRKGKARQHEEAEEA